MSRSTLKRLAAVVSGVVVLALGGAVIARATGAFDDDAQVKGPQADRAKAAALKLTGGGHANAVERDSEKGAVYEVEVTKPNGSTVDVRLDENLRLVAVDSDSEARDSNGD